MRIVTLYQQKHQFYKQTIEKYVKFTQYQSSKNALFTPFNGFENKIKIEKLKFKI